MVGSRGSVRAALLHGKGHRLLTPQGVRDRLTRSGEQLLGQLGCQVGALPGGLGQVPRVANVSVVARPIDATPGNSPNGTLTIRSSAPGAANAAMACFDPSAYAAR